MSPTPDEIKQVAARTAAMWTSDWSIYLGELQRLTGLTLEHCLLFDMMCTFRDINSAQHKNMEIVAKHLKDPELQDQLFVKQTKRTQNPRVPIRSSLNKARARTGKTGKRAFS